MDKITAAMRRDRHRRLRKRGMLQNDFVDFETNPTYERIISKLSKKRPALNIYKLEQEAQRILLGSCNNKRRADK